MTDEQKELIATTASACQKDAGATDVDLEEMIKRVAPTTKSGKCMRKCVMEKFNLVRTTYNR